MFTATWFDKIRCSLLLLAIPGMMVLQYSDIGIRDRQWFVFSFVLIAVIHTSLIFKLSQAVEQSRFWRFVVFLPNIFVSWSVVRSGLTAMTSVIFESGFLFFVVILVIYTCLIFFKAAWNKSLWLRGLIFLST